MPVLPGGTLTSLMRRARQLWPVAVLVAAAVLVFTQGWHRWLTFEAVGMNYAALRLLIEGHLFLALLSYMAIYVLVVALSLPGGLVLTVGGGLLFGWIYAAPAVVVAATVGAVLVYLAARSSFGGAMNRNAGPWIAKLRAGFQENALSYLLFLRLVPVFPFVVVNIAPALLGVSLPTFVLGTVLGIIPGTVAFAIAGAGLGSVVEAQNRQFMECLSSRATGAPPCHYGLDAAALITPELVAAFVVLGIVALVPVVAKKWSKRHAAQ
jgi:uncharacterized membrane protein YdjX (TVP38/TMEM64 family)